MQEEALKTKLVRNNILTAMRDEGKESEDFVGNAFLLILH